MLENIYKKNNKLFVDKCIFVPTDIFWHHYFSYDVFYTMYMYNVCL
jgi:hypothetical protein